MLDSDEPENGLKYLKDKIDNYSKGKNLIKNLFEIFIYLFKNIQKHKKDNNEEVRKLKESYETLLRFSFLAQDEEQFSNESEYSKDQLHNFYAATKLGQISPENNNLDNNTKKQENVVDEEKTETS